MIGAFQQCISVVACQRNLCPNVIPMTMNVFIFRNLSLKTVFIEPYVKLNYSISLSLSRESIRVALFSIEVIAKNMETIVLQFSGRNMSIQWSK